MLKRIFLAAGFLIVSVLPITYAQSGVIKNIQLRINTAGDSASLYYDISMNDTVNINKTYTSIKEFKKNDSVLYMNAADNTEMPGNDVKIAPLEKGIRFVVYFHKDINLSLLNQVLSKKASTYLYLTNDINIFFKDSNEPFVLTKDVLKELTLSAKSLTGEQKELIITNINGSGYGIKNDLDFSKEVNNRDSTQSEYILNFDIQRPFISSITGGSFYYRLKGRISTNGQNPLNTIEAYILYNIKDHFYFEAGRIGPQKFNVNSLRANLGYETLIPNLIDLTGGQPRFRLKPDIKFGLAYQQNFQAGNPFGNKKGNLLIFADGYYYIPVLDKFALIADCDARYSNELPAGNKFLFKYSMTFGYETPLDGLKVMFKVVNGKNEVNPGNATIYSLGLLMGLIK